jgi:DNA invertase Pin-like site-specific DNA recombinase
MRAGLYARVSTNDQKCEMQLREMREYCKRREWEIEGEYVDKAQSGSKTSRPALKQITDAAHRRKIDCVMVWKLDRWGRNMIHAMESIQDLAAHGVRWIAITQGLDTHQSNPMAKAMLGMMAVFAEFEREMIRERTISGLNTAQQNGATFGRPRKAVSKTNIERLLAQGLSLREVARKLKVPFTSVRRHLNPEIYTYVPVRNGRAIGAALN